MLAGQQGDGGQPHGLLLAEDDATDVVAESGDQDFGFVAHASACSRAANRVLCNSIATVKGPTPPGTGVIRPATSFTPSKSTSPTSPASVRFTPTSTTTAPGLTISGGDGLRPADGDDEDVGRPRDGGQVGGAAVADGHGGVAAAAPLHEHDRNRLADDVAASDHHHVLPGDLHLVAQQQLLDAVRRAGEEPRPVLNHQPDVLRVKGVHVLQRADRFEHPGLGNPFGQRQLDEDAVDRRVAVQPVDQRSNSSVEASAAGRWSWLVKPANWQAFCFART